MSQLNNEVSGWQMVGARFLTVGVGSYRRAKGGLERSMWSWIGVGDISVNSCSAEYRFIWLHIKIFINVCVYSGILLIEV